MIEQLRKIPERLIFNQGDDYFRLGALSFGHKLRRLGPVGGHAPVPSPAAGQRHQLWRIPPRRRWNKDRGSVARHKFRRILADHRLFWCAGLRYGRTVLMAGVVKGGWSRPFLLLLGVGCGQLFVVLSVEKVCRVF